MRDDPCRSAHIGADIASSDFAPPLDQHDSEELVAFIVFAEAVGHHLHIARLEDMQRQNLPRKQHRPKRKHRQRIRQI